MGRNEDGAGPTSRVRGQCNIRGGDSSQAGGCAEKRDGGPGPPPPPEVALRLRLKMEEGSGQPWVVGFPDSSAGKESACNVGDLGWIPGLGRCPGAGIGCLLQDSALENPVDYIGHGATESLTRLPLSLFHLGGEGWPIRGKAQREEYPSQQGRAPRPDRTRDVVVQWEAGVRPWRPWAGQRSGCTLGCNFSLGSLTAMSYFQSNVPATAHAAGGHWVGATPGEEHSRWTISFTPHQKKKSPA